MQRGSGQLMDTAVDFALNVAPQLFDKELVTKAKLDKFKKEVLEMCPYNEDFKFYVGNTSDYVGLSHWNLQADNSFFWTDDKGELDSGVIDWSGMQRPLNYVNSFMGCLGGADGHVLAEMEDDCMKVFADELERFGGPHIEWEELLLRWHLTFIMCCSDTCMWIERDTLREIPKEEWKDITGMFLKGPFLTRKTREKQKKIKKNLENPYLCFLVVP